MSDKPSIRQRLKSELEAPPERKHFGSGWISGVIALVAGVASLLLSLAYLFPDVFATNELRTIITGAAFVPGLLVLMALGYALAILNLALRDDKTLGVVAVATILAASLMVGLVNPKRDDGSIFFGLDFFVLNVMFTGILFIPLERLFPRLREQRLFRTEWREDLFYYFVSSMLVQILTFLATAPSNFISTHTQWTVLRETVGGQPWVLQVIEIMFLTDLAQYWVHRAFHRIPALWYFHAVHHSARSMDWLASARMHFLEIIVLRGLTAIPMFTLGFEASAIQAYLLIVYVYSAFIHANVGWNLDRIGRFVATPRFHHWHHGAERAAIDVNFAIHFPLLDRIFGTYHLPRGEWPKAYGIEGNPVPGGYWRQFLYPFRR